MKIKTSIIAMVMLLSTFVPKANAVTNAELTTLLQKYCIPKSTNTCKNCPLSYDGGVSTENKCNCGGGKFYKLTERDCDICKTGYFSKGYDVDKCTPCANGYYADAEKLSECKKCPAGSKCPQTIAKETPVYKKVTEVETYSCNPHEVSYTYDCNPYSCNPYDCNSYRCGFLWLSTCYETCYRTCYKTCTATKTEYDTCSKNVEKTVLSHYEYEYRGAITPTKCEAGTYSTAGASSCSKCPAGYYCPGGTDKKICPAGTYSSAGAKSCSTCPAGSYCPNAGMSAPKSCPSGQYQPYTGKTSCYTCSDDSESCSYDCNSYECDCDTCTETYSDCSNQVGCTGSAAACGCPTKTRTYKCNCSTCWRSCPGRRTLYYKVSSDRKSCYKSGESSCR